MDTTIEERMEMVERAEKGELAWRIAEHVHCRPETVRNGANLVEMDWVCFIYLKITYQVGRGGRAR